MANERRSFAGAAVATTLSAGIASGDTSFVLVSSTGWPTGSSGDFFAVIGRGTASEEKIRCSSRTGGTVSVASSGRGADSTSAAAHSAGDAVEHCLTALDLNEANLAVNMTVGKVAAAGSILVSDASASFAALDVKGTGKIIVGNGTTATDVSVSGDATLASTGALTIANSAVTLAKMANMNTASLLGRQTAGSGAPEVLALNATLSLDGSSNLQRAALTGDVTASAGSNATTIANAAVTYAKIQNVSATSRVLGRITAGAGSPEELTAANLKTILALVSTDITNFALDSYAAAQTFNTQTTSYTLVSGDAGKAVEMNVGSANNLTVPTNASVAFPIGTIISVYQYGAGQTTVVAAGGVTVRSALTLKLRKQYAGATLQKRGTDEWYLTGDLASS